MSRRLSFRQRLTIYSAAGIALVLLGGSAATYVIVRNQLRGEIDESLSNHAALVSALGFERATVVQLERGAMPPAGGPPAGIGMYVAQGGEFGATPVYLLEIDADGQPVPPIPGGAGLPVPERGLEIARTGRGAYFTDVHVRGTHLRMHVTAAGGSNALIVARSLSEVDGALRALGWSLAVTCLAGILLAAIVGAVVARRALRPVRELTATAERITHTRDLGERIDTEGDDELSRLGTTFNAMLDSLEWALRSQRQLVSDASHELRTPVTSLRTNIDLLRQGVVLSDRDRERLLGDVTRELDELTALVANIVELARGSQRDLHLERVRLDEVVDRVVQRARARFPSLEFALDAEDGTVWGNQEELERAVWNLVENAAKWSNGGRIELRIVDGEITVRDHGPGVPEADRPFIFERFYRADAARGQPGSGLGLAIVGQIAESHGGRVEVAEAEGGGALFRLVLVRS